jgi:predicted ATPase
MLSSIELENYRGFRQYRLGRLSRVNLLVGKNNCGKTSILEAVHLLASGGDPGVLTSTAWQRGEVTVVPGRNDERHPLTPLVSHFFHGHAFGPGVSFAVRTSDGMGEISVRVENLEDVQTRDASGKQKLLFEQALLFAEGTDLRAVLAMVFEGPKCLPAGEPQVLPVTEDGAISPDASYRYRRSPRREADTTRSVQFISPDSLEPRSMGEMWNKVITEGRESEVIEAMRILEPSLTSVFFLTGETGYRFGGRAGVLVAFEGTRRRDPLGSYGEGMRRLLALSLSLIRAEGGVLLVDEIDTGLHYSVMGDMWRLVVEAAKRADVQVFATTHSSDCVNGLAWLCDNYPKLRTEISLQKIESELEEAVALDGDQIVVARDQGMEVR